MGLTKIGFIAILTMLGFNSSDVKALEYSPGFYYDNGKSSNNSLWKITSLVIPLKTLLSGMGQTEFGVLDLDRQELLEREMLTLLGITHIPENAAHKVNKTILRLLKNLTSMLY